jgi:hypothetical protein
VGLELPDWRPAWQCKMWGMNKISLASFYHRVNDRMKVAVKSAPSRSFLACTIGIGRIDRRVCDGVLCRTRRLFIEHPRAVSTLYKPRTCPQMGTKLFCNSSCGTYASLIEDIFHVPYRDEVEVFRNLKTQVCLKAAIHYSRVIV